LAQYAASKSYIEQFSESLASEVASKGVHVQVQSPLYVATKLAKIRNSSLTVPTPEGYAKAAIKMIGYETCSSPYWSHGLLMGIAALFPRSVSAWFVRGQHLSIRKRALQKAQQKKE